MLNRYALPGLDSISSGLQTFPHRYLNPLFCFGILSFWGMVLGFDLAPSVPLPQSAIPSTLATVVSGPMKGPLDLSIPSPLGHERAV